MPTTTYGCTGRLVIGQLWNYYRKYRDRELRASKLAAQLAEAQLTVLKMQLDPHFLFNTLHAVSSLMHEDLEAVDEMITRLSDLLRLSLENVNDQEVTLKREMEFLQGYVEIQRTRFRDRLTVHMDIDPVAFDAMVPNMILQPLVENAVTHGIAPRSTAGEIRIRARRADGLLRLEVIDNGKGLADDLANLSNKGLGLANTRARLRQLYGGRYHFSLQRGTPEGVVVTLEIPYHIAGGELEAQKPHPENSNHHRG